MSTASSLALRRKASRAPRVLIVRVGAMGDVIHALPAVAMLREVLPEAHIGWAIEPRWAPLLQVKGTTKRDAQRMPLVDVVHPVEAKQWNRQPASLATLRSIRALRRALHAQNYDIAIDLQGTLRSAVIARMSGAPDRIGSAEPREAIARFLYRTRLPRTATHVTDQARELLQPVLEAVGAPGIGKAEPATTGTLSLLPRDAEAEAWWNAWRDRVCGARPIVLLAATAGWGAKEWPPEAFAELAAALVDRCYCVLFNTASGGDDPITARVLAHVRERHPEQAPHVHTLAATLPQLIAATRDMRAVIAGDTGPLHLAAALGIPVVGLFGPTAPQRTGPQHRAVLLRHAASVTDHRRHAAVEHGLSLLTVDQVLKAFERVHEAR